LPEFIGTQLQTATEVAASSFDANYVVKAIFISGRVRESASLKSALYIRPTMIAIQSVQLYDLSSTHAYL